MAEFVQMKHKDRDNVVRVSRNAFLAVWQSKGFELVGGPLAGPGPDAPETPAQTPEELAGELTPGGLPDGTVDEVVAWVGNDQARAQLALDAEQAKDSPRKTAVAALEQVLGIEDDETPDD